MSLNSLFEPVVLGDIKLNNRVVMAPMTRNRANPDGCANTIMRDYYAERAGAGLIVAEGTFPSFEGQAYCRQPGICNAEHVAAWREVTDAVHAKGGKIVLQIMHSGRIGSKHVKGDDVRTVSSCAIAARGEVFTDAAGMQPFDTPHMLTTDEVKQVVQEHKQAAENAKAAGFDGVELHCTSGYLPMQFMCTESNQRTDEYGGNAANRVRFALECVQAFCEVYGSGCVGVRMNPGNTYNDCHDADSADTHATLLQAIAPLGLAYVHIMHAPPNREDIDAFALAKTHFNGKVILNDGFAAASAAQAIQAGTGDAVSFARHFVANPDLITRFKHDYPLAKFDRKTLYTEGSEGYTSYPSYSETTKA